MMDPVTVKSGTSPLILALPHTGTFVPPDVWAALNERGRRLTDTDWHLDRLYDDLVPDATVVAANFHRYVIDANRDPSGISLYPGQNTTALCPLTDFDGYSIYEQGREPDAGEIDRRRTLFHAPYHQVLATEIDRVRSANGVAVLYDCHSIRSHIPFLFEGKLPDLNVGTNNGVTCAPGMEKAVATLCSNASDYTSVLNGRFRGGWTTRHYAGPDRNIHTIQMELAQSTHLETETTPFAYDEGKAARLRPLLKTILETLVAQARVVSEKA